MVKEIMSIRLSADGLSFWIDKRDENSVECIHGPVEFSLGGEGQPRCKSASDAVSQYCGILASHGMDLPGKRKLYADTLKCVLVPEELFREEDAKRYLHLHGIEFTEGEYTVCSRPVCGSVAVMRLKKKVMEKLGSRLGEFDVAHMLQFNMERESSAADGCSRIRIYISPGLCHITAYGTEGLVAAESYPVDSAADIVYYLDCITRLQGLDPGIPVLVDGHRAGEVAGALSRTFKGARCV